MSLNVCQEYLLLLFLLPSLLNYLFCVFFMRYPSHFSSLEKVTAFSWVNGDAGLTVV